MVRWSRAGAYTFQITITKTYNVTNLFEDIKGLYRIAGLKGQQVRLILAMTFARIAFISVIERTLMEAQLACAEPALLQNASQVKWAH